MGQLRLIWAFSLSGSLPFAIRVQIFNIPVESKLGSPTMFKLGQNDHHKKLLKKKFFLPAKVDAFRNPEAVKNGKNA